MLLEQHYQMNPKLYNKKEKISILLTKTMIYSFFLATLTRIRAA